MVLKLHRRQDGAVLIVNMDHIISVFEGRYKSEQGAVLAHEKGTYEVRESVKQISEMMGVK